MGLAGIGRLLWVARLLVAITVLLLLVQLHTAIIRTPLTFAGARVDVPLILAIGDLCGSFAPVPPAFAPNDLEQPRTVCPGPARIVTTAPRGQHVLAFVNGVLIEDRSSEGPVATFDVQLRPGPNEIAVQNRDAYLAYPFLSRYMPAEIGLARMSDRFRTLVGFVPRTPVPAVLTVSATTKLVH